jgi:NitT/TauT family transport system permease protein
MASAGAAQHMLRPAIALLGLFAAWEVAVRALGVPHHLLPAPSRIAAEIAANAGDLAFHAWATLRVLLAGFALSVLVGVPLAMAVSFSPFFRRTLYPVIVFSQLIPKIAVAPLFIIWFGFGALPKVLIAFLVSFFPVVIDSIVGFTSIRPETIRVARSMGASPLDLFLKVRLPAALPNIFAGLKMAMAAAAVGAIVGEFVASSEGLGYLLQVANGEIKTPLAFACLILLSLMGIVLYFAIESVERVAIRWHVSQRVGATL